MIDGSLRRPELSLASLALQSALQQDASFELLVASVEHRRLEIAEAELVGRAREHDITLLTGNADPRGQLPWPFGNTDYLVWWATGSWPLWLASIPSLAYLIFGRPTDARRLLAAGWTCSAWVQVALPGLTVRRVTLEDVYLSLTRSPGEGGPGAGSPGGDSVAEGSPAQEARR